MADDFLSDEDKALFRESMRSVKPLNEKTKRVKVEAPKPSIQSKKINPWKSKKRKNITYRI